MRPGRERWLAVGVAIVAIGAWVLITSRPGLWATGCYAGCASGATDAAGLRVIDLNMLHGYPGFTHLDQREALILDEIARDRADVVLLQEVPWTPQTGARVADLAHRAGMNWAYRRANGNRRAIGFEEGDAILSRYPMNKVASVELPWGDDFFEHRTAVAATLDTPWGPVRVVSTHLSGTPASVAASQVSALRTFVEAGAPATTIIGGDFNAHADTPPMRELATTWRDVMLGADPADPGLTCCRDPEAPAGTPLVERIDYLWLRGPGSVAEARRILVEPVAVPGCCTLAASDHVGLFAVIDVRSAAP
jgi:endonuclease/exonuclease/phosphatase family metal-dependent hydrolase